MFLGNQDNQASIQATIDCLGLDDSGNRELRARYFQEYCQGEFTSDFLRKRFPFVWYETNRQRLL